MSLIYNGTTIKKLIYNGTEMKKMIYGSTEVYSSILTKIVSLKIMLTTNHEEGNQIYGIYGSTTTLSNINIISISPASATYGQFMTKFTFTNDENAGYIKASSVGYYVGTFLRYEYPEVTVTYIEV